VLQLAQAAKLTSKLAHTMMQQNALTTAMVACTSDKDLLISSTQGKGNHVLIAGAVLAALE